MRYRKIMVAGCCMVVGVICTCVKQTSAQDADPFGGSTGSQHKATQAKVITRHSLNIVEHPVSLTHRLSDKIRQRLQAPITLDYDEEAWSDVEQDLESRLGINIILDQSAKDDSLDVDEPMSIQLRDVPGNYALRLLLGEKNATYFVQAGVVRVISLDESQEPEYFVRKVFDANSLLSAINRWNHLHRQKSKKPAAPESETSDSNHSTSSHSRVIVRAAASAGQYGGGGGGRGGGGSGVFVQGSSGPGTETSGLSPAEEQLTELIFQSVDQDQWMDYGSGMATMSVVCGQLVVFGSESLVTDIDELLSDLSVKLASD